MNVFIDLGSHRGKIIRAFIASPMYKDNFLLHAFEANPLIGPEVFATYPKNVVIHKSAAWIKNGTLQFFVNHSDTKSQGSTLLHGKVTGKLDYKRPVNVKCIDFSEWIKRFKIDDNIICKCNIEGAEYELFSKMFADGTLGYIKKIYLRRHWKNLSLLKSVDDNLTKILSASKVEIRNDYSEFMK
jgi:FkbM family methyltransferase